MGMCKKCSKMCGWIVLAVGVLFLLNDLGVWDFWGINWWTAAFVLYGAAGIGSSGCPNCGCCSGKDSGKKKK